MSAGAEAHRASTSLERDATCLIPQFDIHIRFVEHAYLGFFRERKRIEEVYIDSLQKLHRKAKGIDAYFDSSVGSCTMRAAWDEVRDSLERETQVRQEFVTTLADGVIRPLITLKDTQARTRERVKVDLKESAAAHADFAKKIPKSRETYLKRCQELKDLDPLSMDPSNDVPSSLSSSDLSSTSDILSLMSPRLHGRDRSSVLGVPRALMPSTPTSVTEYTRQRFSQLIRGSKPNIDIATRSVLAREAVDQADKEYRVAIHDLETLRLRRKASLDGSCKSLEGFVLEGTKTAKEVLLCYVSAIIKACSAHSRLAEGAQSVVENVSAENDASVLSASVRRSPALFVPRPIFYYNYHVSECPDLVFGRKLVDYATARDSEKVPKILTVCIEEVNRRGLPVEGIYRVTGRHAKVKELQRRFERSESTFSFNPERDDIYSIASLLKLYLEELPEPLFRLSLQDRIRDSERLADDITNASLLRSKIRGLTPIHRVSLRVLVRHLSLVASHARTNNMDTKSLAAVFGLVVFGEDEIPRGDPHALWSKDLVMETLIGNADNLFEDSLPTRPVRPLPVPINTRDARASRTSVVSPRFEEAQLGEFTPPCSPRSIVTSISSSSPSCPPMSPSCSSADSSGSQWQTQTPVLSSLPNFSALHIFTGAADQPELQQVRIPVADTRDTAVLHERELNRSQVFLPSHQERQRSLEASLAYMSPRTTTSWASTGDDGCTTVADMMSPPALRHMPFGP